MDSLRGLFDNLGNSLELEEILSNFDQDLRRVILYDAISVLQRDTSGFAPVYAAGVPSGEIPFFETRAGRQSLATALNECRPVLHAIGIANILIFPLRATLLKLAEPTAILALHRHNEIAFEPADAGYLHAIAPKLAACIDNAVTYRRARQIAGADPATGLANTRSLFERLDAELARARRAKDPLGVLHCALRGLDDGLDPSGPSCSPAAVSTPFEMVARSLTEHCREYDTLARSADDLVLVLPGFRPEFLEEKRTAIQRVFADCGLKVGFPLYAAIGAAFFPDDGTDAEDLLTIAATRLMLQGEGCSRPLKDEAQCHLNHPGRSIAP